MEADREGLHRPTDPQSFPLREADSSASCPTSERLDFPVAVVLPAGGSGERTGLATPKQFCTFLGRPLISYTIQAFERVTWVKNIVIVVANESLDLMKNIIQKHGHKKVKVVLGGPTRHRSIFNGLRVFMESQDDSQLTKPKVVVIHDAVRPFMEEEFLLKIANAAKEHGAAGAIRPLVSTVIATTSEGYLDHSLERTKYRASEMPQAFLFDTIYQAYQQCTEYDFEFGTECLHLVLQYCGTNAKLVEGPPTLWKVTYIRDLFAAESIIKENLSQRACVITGVHQEAVHLTHCLQKTLAQSMVDTVSTWHGSDGSSPSTVLENYNLIYISVNSSSFHEINKLVETIGNTALPVLYPVVLIMMHLSLSECMSFSKTWDELSAIKKLAKEVKERNILVYGLLLNYTKDAEKWNDAVENASVIALSLIKDRNAALTGQMFVV
ncbi:D-ribitol-5-phosphate cytidylyltransferase isoform X2 [Amia ocellicauda]|uniref:D-ribitol-5-phosphate cytidylyltransferase isoform X2 n=1 Tax=Amia ocellicauda TaxID=2972642 RepID=UPI003464BE64